MLFRPTLMQSSRATCGQTDICKQCLPHMRMIDTLIALPAPIRILLDYVQYSLLRHPVSTPWTNLRTFIWCFWCQNAWQVLSTFQS